MPTLRVVIQEVTGLPEKMGLFDKTDPFVSLQLGNQVQKTNVKKNAGAAATFNQVFTFTYNNEPQLLLYCMDSGRKDELIATAVINLSQGMLCSGSWSGTFPMVPNKGLQKKSSPQIAFTMNIV